MKRVLVATLLAALALVPGAQAQVFMSDGVEYVKTLPQHTDTSGGRLHEGFYYLTTTRDLVIYDVKDPVNPTMLSITPLGRPGQPAFAEEDPDTNGDILLVSNIDFMVYDVKEKNSPTLLATLPGVDEHTFTCILDCTWAYGSEGAIVDLRDPAKPRLSDKEWDADVSSNHDVTEIAPGIVLSATEPMLLLDARANPEEPVKLATTEVPGFTHATAWPHQGTDDFALVGGEATGPMCSDAASATFQSWDTRRWQLDKSFTLVSQYSLSTGLPPQGQSPEATFCVHWYDVHPSYRHGGLAAIAWYEHGVRFLQVAPDGKISEVGWYVPVAGQSSDVDWITGDVIYVADYLHGLEILRWTGPIPAGRGGAGNPAPWAPGGGPSNPIGPQGPPPPSGKPKPSFSQLVTLPSARRCARAASFRLRVRRASDPVRSLTISINGRRVASVKGSKLRRPIRVKRLPRKRRFSLQVVVRTRSGHRTAGQRSYRGC